MHAFRIFVKILAVGVGLLGVGWMIVGPWMFFAALSARRGQQDAATDAGVFISIGLGTLLVLILGFLIVIRALGHLRKPELKSANEVVGLATFFFSLWLFNLGKKYFVLANPDGSLPPNMQLLWQLGVLLACYLVYRFVLKRAVARAFPAGDTPPMASGS